MHGRTDCARGAAAGRLARAGQMAAVQQRATAGLSLRQPLPIPICMATITTDHFWLQSRAGLRWTADTINKVGPVSGDAFTC